MTREKVKELLPVLDAYANGKTIQYCHKYPEPHWEDVKPDEQLDFRGDVINYRIKPEPKYRPFNNSKECWEEMQKHQPFGWVKCKNEDCYMVHIEVNNDFDFKFCFKEYIFTDGTPFGIKE